VALRQNRRQDLLIADRPQTLIVPIPFKPIVIISVTVPAFCGSPGTVSLSTDALINDQANPDRDGA